MDKLTNIYYTTAHAKYVFILLDNARLVTGVFRKSIRDECYRFSSIRRVTVARHCANLECRSRPNCKAPKTGPALTPSWAYTPMRDES
jgi:hypothetical protein